MGTNEEGFLQGGVSGAASGASIGAVLGPKGAAVGAVIGFAAGSVLGWSSTDKQRKAQKKAAKEVERQRRESIARSMGEKEQASMMAFSAAMRGPSNSGSSNNNRPGVVATGGEGTIGSNLSTSGTF